MPYKLSYIACTICIVCFFFDTAFTQERDSLLYMPRMHDACVFNNTPRNWGAVRASYDYALRENKHIAGVGVGYGMGTPFSGLVVFGGVQLLNDSRGFQVEPEIGAHLHFLMTGAASIAITPHRLHPKIGLSIFGVVNAMAGYSFRLREGALFEGPTIGVSIQLPVIGTFL